MRTLGRIAAAGGGASLFLLLLLALSGCERRPGDRTGPPVQVAGSPIVYQELLHGLPETVFQRNTFEPVGAIRVDLERGEVSLVPDRGLPPGAAHDRRGRAFVLEADRVSMVGLSGEGRTLRSGGRLKSLCLAADGAAVHVFLLERQGPGPGERPWRLVRVDAETGEALTCPLPGDLGEGSARGDHALSAQSREVVFLCVGTRTWRGDLSEGRWGPPIEGGYRVIDARGTLLEWRVRSWIAKTRSFSDSRIFVIRDGVREEIDLGLGGFEYPVFDTGYVGLHDPAEDRYVYRSLDGAPDVWVPRRPPPYRGPPIRGLPEIR